MPADKPSCSANQCFFHIQNLKPKYINNKKICSEFFSGPLLEPSRRQQRLNGRLCRAPRVLKRPVFAKADVGAPRAGALAPHTKSLRQDDSKLTRDKGGV